MVAQHAQRDARIDHVHREPQRIANAGATIDEVAHEDDFAACRRGDIEAETVRVIDRLPHDIAERGEQRLQLLAAAVNVSDDIERTGLLALVGPQFRALDDDRIDRVNRV